MNEFACYLQLIKTGKLEDFKIEHFLKIFKENEVKYADHLQYALHLYCSKNVNEKYVAIIKRLVEACYSNNALNGLNNIERFVGCIAYLCVYFIKCNEVNEAVNLINTLEKKKNELTTESVSSTVRSNLFVLHHHFVDAAIKSKSNHLSLLTISLVPLQYIRNADEAIAKKVSRNLKHAINNLTQYKTESFIGILNTAKSILGHLSTINNIIEDFLTIRLFSIIENKANYQDIKKLNLKCKEEIQVLVKLSNWHFGDCWNKVIDGFITPDGCLEEGVDSAEVILKQSRGEERQRCCLILSNFLTPELWAAVRGDNHTVADVKMLHLKFVLLLWNASADFRCYSVETSSHYCLAENLGRCWVALTFLVRSCLKQKIEGCLDLIPVALEGFKSTCVCLDQMSVSNCSQTMCNYLWSHAVVRVANSVEDILSLASGQGKWAIMEEFCRKTTIKILTSKYELPIDNNRVKLLFDRWHLACSRQDSHKDAMMVRTYQILCTSGDAEDVILSWATSKLAASDVDNKITLLEFIAKKKKEIMAHGLDISNVDQKALIIAEAKAYQAISSADLQEAMEKLWECMAKMNASEFESAQVLSCLIAATVHLVQSATVVKFQHEARSLLAALGQIKKWDDSQKALCVVFQGILKYSIFACLASQSRNKCSPESRQIILNLLKTEAEKKIMFGEDVDCDVMPAADGLNLDSEAATLNALEAALGAWMDLPGSWTPAGLSADHVALALDHLHLIGNTACLYGATVLVVRAWTLYYRVAILAQYPAHQLYALGILMGECEVSPDSTMVRAALDLTNQLHKGADVKKLPQFTIEALFTCYLAVAYIYLDHSLFKKCGELTEKCEELVKCVRAEAVFLMLKGRLMCLTSRLLSCAPECCTALEPLNLQRTAYNAFHYVKAALKAATQTNICSKQQCQLLIVMLEVSSWSAALFHALYLTPYVKAFLSDLYSICQSLGLTARTAHLLSLLAQVDITTRELSDAQLKLSNLTTMLGLEPLSQPMIMKKEASNTLEISDARGEVSPLRCMPRRARDLSPLSAMLPRAATSSKSAHPSSCACYSCSRALLSLLALRTRSCEAVAAAMAGDNKISAVYHQYCRQFIDSFNAAKFQKKIQQELPSMFSHDSMSHLQREFSVIAARAKLDFAALCMIPESPTCGLELRLLEDANKLIKSLTYDKTLMEWTWLELRICAHVIATGIEKPVVQLEVPTTQKSMAKTPIASRKVLTIAAPKRHEEVAVDAPQTPIGLPKRGRRILVDDGDMAENSPVSGRKFKKTAAAAATPGVTKLEKPSAVTSLRAKRFPATECKSRTLVLISSSDSEVEKTPSPVKTSSKTTRKPRGGHAKPTILIFDETQDVSADLFESFEKKLEGAKTTSKSVGNKPKSVGIKSKSVAKKTGLEAKTKKLSSSETETKRPQRRGAASQEDSQLNKKIVKTTRL